MTRTVASGTFCDVVALPAGGSCFVYLTATELVMEFMQASGEVSNIWRTPAPHMPGLYLRAAANAMGQVAAAYQGQDGQLYSVVEGGTLRPYGLTYGGFVVGLYASGNDFRAVVQRSATGVQVISLPSGAQYGTAVMKGTSQGFRDVLPDGTFVRGDDAFVMSTHGLTVHQYMTRGSVTVGQVAGGIAAVTSNGWWLAVASQNAFEPHVAIDGTTVLVCARTDRGATLARYAAPYPVQAWPTPTPPPQPVPVMDKPKIDVTRWAPIVSTGVLLEFDVKALSAHVKIFTEDGGIKATVTTPAGSDTTGTYRKVI